MAMRTVYGTQASGAQVGGGTLDAIFADIFGLAAITQCTATGTNAITLTPLANQAVVTTPTPANGQLFSFVAVASATASVTAQVGAGSFFPLFMPGGVNQAGAGGIGNTFAYVVQFLTALNASAGGFVIVSGLPPLEFVNAQTGTTYAVLQADQGKLVTLTNAAAIAVSLSQATGNFGAGWWADFKCLAGSVGSVTITPATSTIDGASTLVLTPGAAARVISDGTNYQVIRTGAVFSKSFISAQQVITSAGGLTLAHSLGVQPNLIQAKLHCTTGEAGYSVGDELIVSNAAFFDGTAARGASIVPDATNLNVRYGSAANVYAVPNKGTGAVVSLTNGNWAAIFMAWA